MSKVLSGIRECPQDLVKVGFTGTRNGMTDAQVSSVVDTLILLAGSGLKEAHHGDCVGADEEFHVAVRTIDGGVKIVGHPPINSSLRARCDFDEERPPQAYLVRNMDIVSDATAMITAPSGPGGKGGTWFTINRARLIGRPLRIVWPDGSFNDENGFAGKLADATPNPTPTDTGGR